jgi:hypothetical protein
MKATRANLLGEFTGKLDGLIYYRSRRNGKLYVRKQFKFKNHPRHADFTSAQKAIYAIKPSEGYKRDLKDYLLQYNKLPESDCKNYQAWTNVYAKLMFGMQKAMQDTVDLRTITRTQMEQLNLPCITVKAAVEAGLLPLVRGYERFVRTI